ncbi:MAG: AAA family ATPase, partial [Clostridia bacterium]
ATSDKRLPQNFKSDYALKSDICFVELTFSINSKIYNIKRIPTQVKVKRNGEEKIEQQSAILTLPNKEILSSINEINQKINEIIGLDISQFRQIVMLPQGEFRKMLEANSKQKEVIFRKIFKTEIYNNLTDKLKKLYDDSYEELKTCQNNIKIYYKSLFTENEELKNIISSDYDANVNIILKKFKEQQTEYKNIIKKINIEKALVENQLKALDISQSKKIYNDFINLENYKNEILKLNNQSEIIKSDKILLEKIKNAIKLSPDFTLLIEKKSAIEKAEKEYLLENKNKKQILVLFNEEKENFEKSKINYDLIDELVK